MKIVFAGTPDFAAAALDAIVSAAPDAGWTVPLVLTQPDRPAGRGMKMQASPVKQRALAHGLEVATPSSLRKGDSADDGAGTAEGRCARRAGGRRLRLDIAP